MTCYKLTKKGSGEFFLCGDLGPHCGDSNCTDVGENLCDYPVVNDLTCDRPICHPHSFEVAPNMHYCPAHTTMWKEFKDSGGVKKELENVVPYKGEDNDS